MSEKTVQKLPIVITLTLPESSSDSHDGTLLVQRGDLACVYQFAYKRIADLTEVIADALIAFAAVEADPPMIADAPSSAPPPAEPTVAVPLKKGEKAVKVSHLQLTGGETDAAAYKQAVLIAGKLIDDGLWDGETPIRIDDVYALARKMKYLTARDLSLFTLTDFVQNGSQRVEQPIAVGV